MNVARLCPAARIRLPQAVASPSPPAPTKVEEAPVPRYLARVAYRALEQLGSMAATTAGLVMGTSLGSLWAVPLGVQQINLMLMAAGTLGSGLVGAAAGYALSSRLEAPRSGRELPLALAGALRGLPSIAYPTLSGATPAEQAQIMNALDGLPLGEVTSFSTLKVEPRLDTAGLSLPLLSHNHILLDRGHLPNHLRDLRCDRPHG